ncbi:MAG TPA: tetratricopeptide repeat protein [Candidatus Acidoferrales bacterium]|nr:tetratricopeptide repeat protein [Candidatus Acidoferrales bacterium]
MTSTSIRSSFRVYSAFALLALLIGIGATAGKIHAQQSLVVSDPGIAVEASPQVFATMCALEAAGFDADESTLSEMPARLALRGDLLRMQGPATEALRQFYRDHALANSAETLSRYITFALYVGPPPQFQFQSSRELLPPDVLTIEGFQEVLANFYREAQLETRWAKIEPESGPAIVRYRASLRKIVMVSNGYLREIVRPANGRRFTVYVEPLVGARTNFRNSGSDYAIVVGSVSDTSENAVQHAYLHFMLDGLVLRYRPAVETKRALLNVAASAPRLPVEYHDDFVALADECLIKAVELRLRHLSPEKLQSALQDADQSGFVLVRPFVTQLQKFEKAEPAMSYYFPDLLAGIDVQAEKKRLQSVTFAAAETAPAAQQSDSENAPPSELDRWLAEGDREIAQRDSSAAAATFETALAKYPNNPRALYGLAIASVLSGQGDRARDLFEQLVSGADSPATGQTDSAQAADPTIVAWSHVYLGRIHDLEDDRDLAVSEYRAALAVRGAPESARTAAQSGVEMAYKPSARPDENRQPQP